jgi:hypothetical protein
MVQSLFGHELGGDHAKAPPTDDEKNDGMMKPEDMPRMMETMMDSVFKEMSVEDRVAFMQNMMPRCMTMMFSELDLNARRATS